MVSTFEQDDELKILLLTGQPGVGKTTVVTRLYSYYSARGLRIQGISTREIRENGVRLGFKIRDVGTGREGWLARKDYSAGPRVGPYHVISEDLENIGVVGLQQAIQGPADMIVVDEIGPMEMTSPAFRNVISAILSGERPTVATVKLGSRYPEVERIRVRSTQLEITKENREEIFHKVTEYVDAWLKE